MKKNFIIILVAAGFMLVACQKEKFVEATESQGNEILLKSATISSKSAIEGSAFPDGYGMLVSAFRNAETGASASRDDFSSNYFEGITFKKASDSSLYWVPTTPKYWPLDGTLDFLCIASAGIANEADGVVPTCTWNSGNIASGVIAVVPDNGEKFDDILYGSANTQTYFSTGIPITFNHAQCAVVFFAKSNIPYDEARNIGITVTGITVNNPKTGGSLIVSNPQAGGNPTAAAISASWNLSSAPTTTTIEARVWDSDGAGVKTDEPVFSELNLTTTYNDEGANVSTPTALITKKFGDAYVILPPQNAVSFTISYTLHNGFQADGTTALDNALKYTYTPVSGEKWDMGKKVIYLINITLHEIQISQKVADWENDRRNIDI